ncbi:TauD/TfdA family dioxygenase [Chitinophaga nivalis]|uniref:TauD/TfdA family dioxygenase n=1 Tax=Chitinophaga nivalis TaxID=2991709 RepID=A0ABT3IJW9_9BACT|nr:TauD/TfdA family dioxygenase [Chitinophaga nivalis]MCW3466088.1 TauD/TfdA family dioxygenase [Chitinophaga nivalis]MCW3484221.1 TauD/TfdA family dioxygenase [Chitinophaga nivalis]
MEKLNIQEIAGRKMLLQTANIGISPVDWAVQYKEAVAAVLAEEGALLIRGLNIKSGEEFSRMLTLFFGSEPGAYTYRSTPRTSVEHNIYTASEYHPSETIPQHNENAYAHTWPLTIGFLCVQKAATMGNTPISDSRVAYAQIPADIREEFERKKVMYVRNYSDVDLPWTEVFQTTEKGEVEAFCKAHNIGFEWTETGLRTKQINQGVIQHPVTAEKLWFNQAHLFHVSSLQEDLQESLLDLLGEEFLPRNAYFGDGTPIDTEALSIIREVYDNTKFSFQWENQDLLLLDNMLFTHGREPFSGDRKVLVGMGRNYIPAS